MKTDYEVLLEELEEDKRLRERCPALMREVDRLEDTIFSGSVRGAALAKARQRLAGARERLEVERARLEAEKGAA